MAYDVNKPKDRKDEATGGNPYEAALGTAPTSTVAPTFDGPSRTAPAAPESMSGASGPSATGYVNFDRLYNANAGVAQREAGKKADAAEKAGQQAVAGRTGAQQSFAGAARTGANQGPNSTDYQYAAGQRNFYDPSQFVQAPSTGGAAVAAARGPQGATMMPEMTREQFEGRLASQAKKGYAGPAALSAQNGYDELLKQTEAAQQQATNPLVGLNQTDAALLGAAGRPRFAEVASKYGSLKDDLDKANTASIGDAKAAVAASKGAQGDYERLLQDYEAKQAADEAAKPKPIVLDAAPGVTSTPGERGWPEGMDQQRRKLGEDMTLDQAKSNGFWGSTNPKGFTDQVIGLAEYFRPEGEEAGEAGWDHPSFAQAEYIMRSINADDWAAYQNALKRGPDSIRQWVAAMQAKYGV